jgi:hypothetical protein
MVSANNSGLTPLSNDARIKSITELSTAAQNEKKQGKSFQVHAEAWF